MLLLGCIVFGLAAVVKSSQELLMHIPICIKNRHLKNADKILPSNCNCERPAATSTYAELFNRGIKDHIRTNDVAENLEHLHLVAISIDEIESDALDRFTSLKKLEIHHNILENTTFLRNITTSLIELDLSFNSINAITFGDYQNLINLKYLDLYKNTIRELKAHSLSGLSSLESLNLAHNRINNIEYGFIQDLKKLKLLDLRNNDISRLDEVVFSSITDIGPIYLTNNNHVTIFSNVFNELPSGLRAVHLEGNPLSIDDSINITSVFGTTMEP